MGLVSADKSVWIIVVLQAVLYAPLCLLLARVLRGTFKPWYVHLPANLASIIILGLISAVSLYFFQSPGNYGSLADAIASQPSYSGGSYLVGSLFRLNGLLAGFGFYGHSTLQTAGGTVAIYGLLLYYMTWYLFFTGTSVVFSAFIVPTQEYRRIFLKPEEVDVPDKVPEPRAVLAGIFLALLLSSSLVLVSATEGYLRQIGASPGLDAVRAKVEQIDGQYVKVGTIDQVASIERRALAALARQDMIVRDEIRSGFAKMRDNVDTYLDWYYSLPAEIARLAAFVGGNPEEALKRKVGEHLTAGNPMSGLDTAISRSEGMRQMLLEFRAINADIIESNRVSPSPWVPLDVERMATLKGIAPTVLAPPEELDFRKRLQIGSAAALGGGAVSMIAGRMVVSGTFRTAATVARTAFRAVVGAAAGTVGGVAAGIGAETLARQLEEKFSRPDHKKQILAAIDDAERDMLARLPPPPVAKKR